MPLVDDLGLAWAHLRGAALKRDGWQTIALASAPTVELRAGCRDDGAEALLAGFPGVRVTRNSIPNESEGFVVETVSIPGSGSTWLAVTRKPGSALDLFRNVADDLAATVYENPSVSADGLMSLFVGRIRAWQEFMRKSRATLSAEEELGLVGELIILKELINVGIQPAEAVRAWEGPLAGLQDFALGSGAIEAKTSLSTDGFPARIASLEQLDDANRQPLFVAAIRLCASTSGKTLPGWVETIRELISGDAEAERLFSERLCFAGYNDEHVSLYERCFVKNEIRMIEVDKGFPRLTPGSVPAGVRSAMYEIELEHVQARIPALSVALKQLGVI